VQRYPNAGTFHLPKLCRFRLPAALIDAASLPPIIINRLMVAYTKNGTLHNSGLTWLPQKMYKGINTLIRQEKTYE
jgi:hypothetical protein